MKPVDRVESDLGLENGDETSLQNIKRLANAGYCTVVLDLFIEGVLLQEICTRVFIWLVVWNIFYFPIYWEEPSELTNIFQRGGPTTNQLWSWDELGLHSLSYPVLVGYGTSFLYDRIPWYTQFVSVPGNYWGFE